MAKEYKISQMVFIAGVAALLALTPPACSDDDYKELPTGDALPRVDATETDAAVPDAMVLPDRINDPDGPEITILKPEADQIKTGNQMTVEARIVRVNSGIDPNSVVAYVTTEDNHPLGRQGGGDDIYKGIVNISALGNGSHTLVVTASDLDGKTSSAELQFVKDLGPTITFLSPQDSGRYLNSAQLSLEVRDEDGVVEDSVTAVVGNTDLPIEKSDQDGENTPPTWITYDYDIVFDDSIFNPPLRGTQMIQVEAVNTNGTKASSSVVFVIDREGPLIEVVTPLPGEIVGGIMQIEVAVSDPADVLSSSVVAVLAGDQVSRTIELLPLGGFYTGSFDTRAFPDTFVFPSLSVRAADSLGNENEVGFLLALDNQSPILSLDPPEDFRMAVKNSTKDWECSWEFDPVGEDAVNKGGTVPQVFWLRARVEDKGNNAFGLVQQRASLVSYSSVKLYILQDTQNYPLVVDTNGDGYCDEMNPDLIPTTTPTESDEVLVLNLTPISPSGNADFTFEPDADLPPQCDLSGMESEVPADLCSVTPMTIAVHYTTDPQEPSIYTLAPVDGGDPLLCVGNQFDALANSIGEGWTCAAVRAVDRLGNIGVSEPLPVCIDYTMDGVPSECHQSTPDMPDCTGTQNPDTLEVTMDPCSFHSEKQLFPEREVRRRD